MAALLKYDDDHYEPVTLTVRADSFARMSEKESKAPPKKLVDMFKRRKEASASK